MAVKVNKDVCCYCGGCTSVCPVAALELKETYIHCDDSKCVSCGACERICPVGAIKVRKEGKA